MDQFCNLEHCEGYGMVEGNWVPSSEFMKQLEQPLPEELKVKYPIHKYLGDARVPFHRPQDHVLCMSVHQELLIGWDVHVTLLNEDVTCKECLEWIHA